MATVLGSEWWTNSTDLAVSQAITVPTGTEMVIWCSVGFTDDVDSYDTRVTQLNFDNGATVDFTLIDVAYYENSSYQSVPVHAYYTLSPPTGAQTIYHTFDLAGGAIQTGVTYGVIYLSGIDTTTPIGDIETHDNLSSETPSSITSALTGVGTEDVGFTVFFSDTQIGFGTGQTVLRNTVFNSNGPGISYEQGESALEVNSMEYPMGVFFAVNDSGAAGTDNLTAADLTSGTPTIDAASLDETVHSLTAADLTGGTPTIDAATLAIVTTDHRSYFGRAGDSDTTVDLTALGYTGPFSVTEAAASISLSGSTVTISHGAAVHDSALISTAGNDVRVWNSTGPADAPQYPLTVDSRRIQDAAGSTMLFNGDAGWALFVGATRTELTTYLSDRAAKNVNLILARLIEHKFTYGAPTNVNGDAPFTGTLAGGEDDFNTPNEAYWLEVDWALREAHRYGMVIATTPAYIGYNHSDEGWAAEIDAHSDAQMTTYGEWLAGRYASFPNLIWVMGGDSVPTDTYNLVSKVNSLANALQANDTAHLITAHSGRRVSAYDAYNETWLDFNTAYSGYTDVYPEVRSAYTQVTMPVLYVEGHYGNEHSMTNLRLRTQTWQAIMAGSVGHIYGNAPTWYFGEDASHPANGFADSGGLDWRNQLDSFAATHLTHVPTILSGIDLATYTPDHAESVLVSGHDPGGTEDEGFAPLSYKATAIVAYMPEAQNVTIATSGLTAGTWDLTWYNPADGTISTEQAIVDGSNLVLSPNHSGVDNVLVMELASTTDALTAADLVGATPTIDAATVGQVHTLTGGDLTGAVPTIDAATLSEIDAPPADVSNLDAVAGNTEIVLTWNDPGDADLNDILVTWEPGSGSQSVATGVETYTIGSLTNGTTYTVTVYARDSVPNASDGVSVVKMPYDPASASGGSYVRASIYGAVRAARRRRN